MTTRLNVFSGTVCVQVFCSQDMRLVYGTGDAQVLPRTLMVRVSSEKQVILLHSSTLASAIISLSTSSDVNRYY